MLMLRPVTPSLIRAWSCAASPSATLGRTGPNRTKALPAVSLPEAAQRTTWPQNRWW